jgi:hypothetical protein
MTNYSFDLGELDRGENLPAQYGNNIRARILNNLRDVVFEVLVEEYPHLSDIERTYVYGMTLGCHTAPAHREAAWDLMESALRLVADNRLGSWITELVQNAQDQDAENIQLTLSEPENEEGELCVSFSHDGSIFSRNELSALLKPFGTTKAANPFTIGRFGIGFKYWNRFFRTLVIRTESNNTRLDLQVTPSDPHFSPRMTVEESEVSGDLTEFQFGGSPIELNEDLIGSVEISDFLEYRIPQSMPLLVRPQSEIFTFTVSDNRQASQSEAILTAASESTGVPSRPLNVEGEVLLPHLAINKVVCESSTENTSEVIKFSLVLSEFLSLNQESADRFKQAKNDELEQIFSGGNHESEHEESALAFQEAFTSTESGLFVSIVYDKNYLQLEDEKGGYFAQRFVTPDSRTGIPFTFDGPFQLIPTRLSLRMDEGDGDALGINEPLLELFAKFHECVTLYMLEPENWEALSVNLPDLDALINHRFTSGEEEIDNAFVQQDFNQILNEHSSAKISGNVDCPDSLLSLWRHLYTNDLINELDWFLNALNPAFGRVEFSENPRSTVLLAKEHLWIDASEENCLWFTQNYGEGLPSVIEGWLTEEMAGEDGLNIQRFLAPLVKEYPDGRDEFYDEGQHRFVFSHDLLTPETEDGDTSDATFFASMAEIFSELKEFLYVVTDDVRVETVSDKALFEYLYLASQEPEQLAILDEKRALTTLEERFRYKQQDGTYSDMRMMLDVDDGNASVLVLLPPTNHLPCVAVGNAGYGLWSMNTKTEDGVRKPNPTEVDCQPKMKLMKWGTQGSALWFVPSNASEPSEPEWALPEHWVRRPMFIEQPKPWVWWRLSGLDGMETPSKVDCLVVDAIALHENAPHEVFIQEAVVHDVEYSVWSESRPHGYQNSNTRSVGNSRNFHLSPSVASRAMVNQGSFPENLAYSRPGAVVQFQRPEIAKHTIVMIHDLYASCLNQVQIGTRHRLHQLLAEIFLMRGHQLGRAYDCFWVRGENHEGGSRLVREGKKRIGWEISPLTRRIYSKPGTQGVLRLSAPLDEATPRITSNLSRLSEASIPAFSSKNPFDHLFDHLVEQYMQGDLYLPFWLEDGQGPVNIPEQIAGVRILPVSRGWTGFSYSDLIKDTPRNRESIAHLVNEVNTNNNNDGNLALDLLNELVENRCVFWANLPLRNMNPQYNDGSYARVMLRDSGHVNQNDHAALYGIIHQAAVDDNWNQFVQAVATNATPELLRERFSQTRIPILVDGENGLELSYEGGPLLSELGNSHVLVDEYDESLNQLIRLDETSLCVLFHESVPCSRFIEVFHACGWMENVNEVAYLRLFEEGRSDAETVDLPENLSWLAFLPALFSEVANVSIVGRERDELPSPGPSSRAVCFFVSTSDGAGTLPELQIQLPTPQSFEVNELLFFWRQIRQHLAKLLHCSSGDVDAYLRSSPDGPWPFPENETEFAQTYCSYASGGAMELYDDFSFAGLDSIDTMITRVSNMYNMGHLAHSANLLKEQKDSFYQNLPSLLSEVFMGNDHMTKLASIWYYMLPRDSEAYTRMRPLHNSDLFPKNSIGEYAIMNAQEHAYFRSRETDETPHYKFVDDFVERMRDSLNETVEADPSNQFIHVEGLCYDSTTTATYHMRFHKVHLIYILGALRAGGVEHA